MINWLKVLFKSNILIPTRTPNSSAARAEEQLILLDFNPIGSLMIYSVQPIGSRNITFTNTIYWSDKVNPIGSGPFTTVYYAIEHYKSTVMSRKDFKLGVWDVEKTPEAANTTLTVVKPVTNVIDMFKYRIKPPQK